MPEPPRNGDAVLDLVRKSELVEDDVLDNFLTRSGPLPQTAPDTATRLVQDGIITPFQAKLILQGKYRGFRIGPYKILDQLGVGGMGQVFLAEHTAMRRKVALKVLPPKLAADRAGVERFHREARAVAALDHPNIVRAHDVNNERGTYYLVLEYVEGQNLETRLQQAGGVLPWGEAVGYVVQAAAGLQHAHEKGLVHRDIKPANILVDKEGVVKVLDMGLARFFEDQTDKLTKNLDGGAVMGTADYVAPEQLLDSSGTDHRADIYSLGATLYHLLTGRPPFEGSTTAKLVAHQLKTATPAHEVNEDVPEDLSDIVENMMAKDPDQRYQVMAEVVRDLLPYAAEGPTSGASGAMPVLALAAAARSTGDLRAALTGGTEVILPGEHESPRTRRKKVLAIAGLGACILGGCGLIAFALMNTPTPLAPVAEDTRPIDVAQIPPTPPYVPPALTPVFSLAVDKLGSEMVVFTPDGKKLVTATDKTVRVWDAATGKPVRTMEGHTAAVRGLALLPGGKEVLSSSHDKTVRRWNIETGDLVQTYDGAPAALVNVAALPNGRRFLTASADGSVWLWDVTSGEVLNRYPDLKQPIPVYGLAVTRDGKRAVIGTWDSKRNSAKNDEDRKKLPPTKVIVFEVETGAVKVTQPVLASVAHVHLSPDSRFAAFGTDKGIGILDLTAAEGKGYRAIGGLTQRTLAAVFSKDGRFVVSTGIDKRLSLWELTPSPGTLIPPPAATSLPGQGNGLGLAPDGKRVAVGGSGGTGAVWDLPPIAVPPPDARPLVPLVRLTGMAGDMEDVVYTPDGKVIGCGSDKTVRVWNPVTGEELRSMPLPARPRGLALLRGDRLLVTLIEEKQPIQMFNWKTGKREREFPSAKPVRMVAAMPDGKRFLALSDDRTVRLWSADATTPEASFDLDANGQGLAVTPDGTRFLVGCMDRTIRLWDIAGNKEIRRLSLDGIAYRITLSRDGRWAAFGNGNKVQFWDVQTGNAKSVDGPKAIVDQVAFTRDGRWAVAASNDRNVYVIDVDKWAVHFLRMEHAGAARGLAISLDGRHAVSSSADGTAVVWQLPPEVVPKG